MNDVEKYFEYHSAEESLIAWKGRIDGFHRKLSAELCEFFFSYWPEMEMNRELINQELSELADYTCNEAYLTLCTAIEYLRQLLPVQGDQSLPESKSREKEEVDLNELFDKFPCLNNDEFIKSYWEDFDLGVKVDNFYFQVHQMIKRILVEFYFTSLKVINYALLTVNCII